MSAKPLSSVTPRTELTARGLIIGVVITLVFTAANVFFGLKAGLTFATSIPAAVISMAILRGFKDSTMQENNIVQTVASSAGTLSAIIFVLPGLVMIGWWTGFPFWVTFGICATGGILGVMYTIPLRRALVTDSDLPYPEGVACAEVLKVGGGDDAVAASAESGKSGLFAVAAGTIVSAVFAVVVATKVFAGSVAQYFHVGDRGGASGYDFSLSFALLAVGHLVGLWVGLAMLLGALIAWGWAVPHYTMLAAATGAAADMAQAAWGTKVRFIGAGTIGVAAIWTLAKLVKPVISGLSSAMASSRARKAGQGSTLPRTEHDMPIGIVGLISLLCLLPIGWLLGDFSIATGLGSHLWLLVGGGLVFVVIMGFLVSAVCGYMAGLIGSSNSPLSGVGILVVIIAALLLLVAGVKSELSGDAGKGLVAFALFATSVVFAVATIANNNLQDLKTGQLVDATPWKQQVALVVGVLVGAAVIPPVLDLLNEAYGFAGMPGVDPARALAAPQAGLISALAQGVIQGNIDWSLIILGGAIGVALIVLDAVLGRTTRSAALPPLAVGLGIYLPTSTTLMIVVGAVVGWYFDKRAERGPKPESTRQLGVLLASGMIVGESIIGVIIAAIVVFSGKGAPLALVGDGFGTAAIWIGGIAFVAVNVALYRWVAGLGRTSATA
ncbi:MULTISPECIES: OPT family oligopeptide transporter [Rhodanobacter]|uniref:OPT family oligopeptide transporter n=1 Tax=Rhodanobacter TaxID=75309 RepID=UPI000416E317|nr:MULTISPECIES: oligopeptide transporter, OPT family [Rhodanobacter]KZC18867.1 oligopeptide transporter, OPT family [Rhodanobacter denitrificans]UJJ49720.1 oligopeptide transporter, OPT family [Rhodanobacter denitrificans]UJM92434.1 oligopeptide transporter, OPT family [Rhodanobacter denitrificans]UJM95964.1 oligopeptide transporter, OPT family [Rhodanobacter denitrificans]UJN21205.1 oligopeptide transporter, OPT family [Rhodanobacter denitrificans]